MKTVAFHTLGCKVNHYESEAMIDLFAKAGYQVVDFAAQADIYVVNTCTVTNEAARKSRQLTRRAKRRNQEAMVVMVGCYPQVSPGEAGEIEGVDLVVGSANRHKIVDYVEGVRSGLDPGFALLHRDELVDFEDLKVEEWRETTRAYVKIEEGCNQFCSYCIIPYARGPVRSRKPELVVAEVEKLVAQGVREIVLTGTHLGAYGSDWRCADSLVKLLQALVKIDRLSQIRLSSIEVLEISDALLELLAGEDKLCPHLHLPLQSGCDQILEQMKRPYRTEQFREIVNKVRQRLTDPAITTDVIVGFPGETEQYFRESFNFIKEMAFSRLHVFPFSPRAGTPAARMGEQVSPAIKKAYSRELLDFNKKLMLNYQRRFIGQVRPVIIEEKRDAETGLLVGISDNYLRVLIDDQEQYQGKLNRVQLIKSYNYENALGKIVR